MLVLDFWSFIVVLLLSSQRRGVRGYPPDRFEYKMALKRYFAAEIYEERVWVFSEKYEF